MLFPDRTRRRASRYSLGRHSRAGCWPRIAVAKGSTPFTPPLTFTASETFDVAEDLGSPVALDYFDRAPFAFNGKINDVHVAYIP